MRFEQDQAAQTASLTAERQALRDLAGLRPLRAEEEGCSVRSLPGGVYGFTGAPATNEIPLFSKPIYECFEIHKRSDGEIVWVGYATQAEADAFERGGEPMSLELYPQPYGEASRLMKIEAAHVDRRRPPTREHGNAMRMDLGPR